MAVQRWSLRDPVTGESYKMPINPREMSSPHGPRNTTGFTKSPIDGQVRTYRARRSPPEWTFGGVIRTQEHHNALRDWCARPGLIELTDHLNRTWQVRLMTFEPTERRPTKLVDWRFTYQVTCVNYGRIA